jgi:hypothetical protein
MGTDIHIMFEIFYDGKWHSLNERHGSIIMASEDIFDGCRNYNAFAILADVRNGTGFAGCKTSDGFNVISEPKGFPDDMSEEVAKWAEGADHTPSWLTLKELLEFDWNQVVNIYGLTRFETYKRWDKKDYPDDMCGGVGGTDVVELEMEEADKLIIPPTKRTYVKINFPLSYKEAAGSYYTNLIPIMQQLGKPEEVRIVFYFDS